MVVSATVLLVNRARVRHRVLLFPLGISQKERADKPEIEMYFLPRRICNSGKAFSPLEAAVKRYRSASFSFASIDRQGDCFPHPSIPHAATVGIRSDSAREDP
jgi:hypothetical protein